MKNIHLWAPAYISEKFGYLCGSRPSKPVHIMFMIADHFEPRRDNPPYSVECEKIKEFIDKYTKVALSRKDSSGRPPQYTFFYPAEEYRKEHLDRLADFCKKGFGEVEVHLHHDNDTAENLKNTLETYKRRLGGHGLLSKDGDGNIRYGFIHGNWALCNSRKDGRMCGINDELKVLKETGCYADFTLPSAPSETQTAKINSIYYAASNSASPKSHNTGVDVEQGRGPSGDLMIIQGPLVFNWKRRKYGILPKIENSEIAFNNPPFPDRVDMWVNKRILVKKRPDWIFIKVYTHGLKGDNMSSEYFKNLDDMYRYLEQAYDDGENYKLHYATAREFYNIVKAAEEGMPGEPELYRDYLLKGI